MSAPLIGADPLVQAQECVNAGRVSEAESIVARVLAESPRHGLARSMAGLVAYLKADYESAERELALAVELEPLHFDAHCIRAFTLASLSRLAGAAREFQRALALDPASTAVRMGLAEVLFCQGQNDEALRILDEGRAHGLTSEQIEAVLTQARAADPEPAGDGTGPEAGTDAPATDARRDGAIEARGSAAPLPGATTHRRAPEVAWLDPRALLHAGRMDVAAKALYARALLGQPPLHSGYPAEDVYLRHILFRTGGAEPGDEARKGSLTSFALEFARLVASLQQSGFDPAQPIPVARRTGLILNGAHRLAAALALGLDRVPVIHEDGVDGLTWDFDWFVDHAFLPLELDELVRAWIDLRGDRAGTVILWPAALEHWDAIEREIGARVAIAARREIELPPAAFGELIRDVYATDWGPAVGENIERKVTFLAGYPPRLRLLVVGTSGAPAELEALKREVRERWGHVVPADRFATLHTTELPRETAHVADLLLSRASLAGLRARPAGGFRPEFVAWMRDYHQALGRLRIDPEHCCVVGSAVLEALGVRDATDLDFTVTHAVREQRFTPGVTHVTPELDVVARDYPRAIARGRAPDDDRLIGDRALHFRVRGLKFASLDVVVTRKLLQRRPKDLADVAKVGRMRLGAGRS